MNDDVSKHEEGMVRFCTRPGYTWRRYFDWRLFVNHDWRRAVLLANSGSSFLFRYEMPNGRTYLHEVSVEANGHFSRLGRSISKTRLPKKWLSAEHICSLELWTE